MRFTGQNISLLLVRELPRHRGRIHETVSTPPEGAGVVHYRSRCARECRVWVHKTVYRRDTRSNADNFLHVPEKDECYVSTVCVSERAGKGVGRASSRKPKRSRGNIKKRDSRSRSSTEIQRNDCIVDSGLNPSKKRALRLVVRELPLVRVHRQKRAREIWTGEDGKTLTYDNTTL